MENSSQTTLLEPFCFLFLHSILSWIARLHKYLTPQSTQENPRKQEAVTVTVTVPVPETDSLQLKREDLKVVMSCMGMSCSHEDENQLMGMVGVEEMSAMFEEEPSLGEVKAAFSVFDENCDGFIDGEELRRVLEKLGFGEGLEVRDCERMIERCDENGDGRIEFGEFVKFMESECC